MHTATCCTGVCRFVFPSLSAQYKTYVSYVYFSTNVFDIKFSFARETWEQVMYIQHIHVAYIQSLLSTYQFKQSSNQIVCISGLYNLIMTHCPMTLKLMRRNSESVVETWPIFQDRHTEQSNLADLHLEQSEWQHQKYKHMTREDVKQPPGSANRPSSECSGSLTCNSDFKPHPCPAP